MRAYYLSSHEYLTRFTVLGMNSFLWSGPESHLITPTTVVISLLHQWTYLTWLFGITTPRVHRCIKPLIVYVCVFSSAAYLDLLVLCES